MSYWNVFSFGQQSKFLFWPLLCPYILVSSFVNLKINNNHFKKFLIPKVHASLKYFTWEKYEWGVLFHTN